ncbi:MAG: DUF2156 domain-containing protein [Candidatus Hydrogenedentes bacterium]|nr:DUF2156 domain-containing protein [Candidatus Hydrogenedentota bacterium]
MPRRVFVTGATGFLGKRFVQSLIGEERVEIYALVRAKAGETPAARLMSLGLGNANINAVAGDVTDAGLPDLSDRLPAIDEFWHVAGLTDFNESRREHLVKVNVEGTHNALELARRVKARRFYHVSTAYVAGIHSEPVPEDYLAPNPVFRNPYEETKYHGEKLVRASQLPWVIVRPSIIMGDSQTGDVENDKMVYGAMKVYNSFRKLVEREYRDLGGPPAELRYCIRGIEGADKNLVCVDDVVRLMSRIRDDGEIGKTYHGTHSQSVTTGTIHDTIIRVLGMHYLTLMPEIPEYMDSKHRFVNKGLRSLAAYMVNHDPPFCQDNVQRLGGWQPKPMSETRVHFLIKKFADASLHSNDDTKTHSSSGHIDLTRFDDVKRFGTFSLAYDTMSVDLSTFRAQGIQGYIAYKVVDHTALMVADPVSANPALILREFVRWCGENDLRLCAIQVTHPIAVELRAAGFAINKLGIETFVDVTPETLAMPGADFQSVRNYNNIAARHGVELREGDLTAQRIQEMRRLSEYWIRTKKNHSELRVLTRRPSENQEPGVRHFFAERGERLLACMFFTPIFSEYKKVGYYASVERYALEDEGLPNRFNAMKFMVYQAIQQFGQENVSYVALGMSPLHNVATSDFNDNPELTKLFEQLYQESELYAFKGLATHKQQYPRRREESVYIATVSDTAPEDILNVFKGVGLLDG